MSQKNGNETPPEIIPVFYSKMKVLHLSFNRSSKNSAKTVITLKIGIVVTIIINSFSPLKNFA